MKIRMIEYNDLVDSPLDLPFTMLNILNLKYFFTLFLILCFEIFLIIFLNINLS